MANPNPTPFLKTGADANPNGRPKKEWTWAGLLDRVADEIEPKSGKLFKELVSKRLWVDAVNGNLGAIKEILNRMEGLPVAKQEIFGKDGQPLSINIIAYGRNDPINVPIQLQPDEVHDTGSGQPKEISGPQLAQESPKDDSSSKPTDQVGG